MVRPLKRFVRPWLAAALLAMAFAPSTTAASPPHRIVAVGDLHGDYDAWLAIARAARLIDPTGHWTGGKATFVQTGDIVDRGGDSLKIVRHLQQLEREAKKAGGEVVVLIGNHEAMIMTGDLRYTAPGEFAAFVDSQSAKRRDALFDRDRKFIAKTFREQDKSLSDAAIRDRWYRQTPLGMIEHQQAWSANGELGRWMLQHKAVVQVGDSIFVHGGISPVYAPITDAVINRRVVDAIAARETDPASIINDPLGPLWYRGLAGLPPETSNGARTAQESVSAQLDRLLSLRRARRIVIGHTPILSGVTVLENGRLARIDSGNSRAYGGNPGYLEIIGPTATAHSVDRPTPAVQGAKP